jgi:hypothetical protein
MAEDANYDNEAQLGRQAVLFLPINQSNSPPQSKRRRAYLSCEACRKRKLRCVPSVAGTRQPCKRCAIDEKTCEFRSTRSTRSRRAMSPDEPSQTNQVHVHEGLVVGSSPVAHAAQAVEHQPQISRNSADGSVYFASPRHLDGAGRVQSLHMSVNSQDPNVSPGPTPTSTNPTTRTRIISAQLHNAADALDLLTFAAANEQDKNSQYPDGTGKVANNGNNRHDNRDTNIGVALQGVGGVENHSQSASSHSRGSNSACAWMAWEKFTLIRRGILTQDEVIEYLDFYFEVLWMLRPVVHPFYRQRERYHRLSQDEPLLLVSLITLASRYHFLSGSHGEIRSERIHWQAWKYLQGYLQSALWGSPCSRSPGAIAAILLMIEWHVKSINNPVGFSEDNDYDLLSDQNSRQGPWGPQSGPITSLTSQQRYGMATLLESLNIVAPAYRSNKMSWLVNKLNLLF